MWFLLFFISIIFSSIFYFFYDLSNSWNIVKDTRFITQYFDSLSWNLLIESFSFLWIAIFFLFFFSSVFYWKKEKSDFTQIKNLIKNNFKTILYYIGFVLFYLSIFLILKDLNFSFSYIIISVNIIILALFFLTKKFFITSDLLKVNTIIFSSIYIFLYLNIFINKWNNFLIVDFINSILIFTSYFLILYSDKVILKRKSDSLFLFYLFIYIFVFLTFYFNNFFWNFFLLASIFSFLINFYIFHFLRKIDFFKNNLVTLKIIGIFFSYFWIVTWICYLYFDSVNYFLLAIIFYLSFFNFKIHKLYENYISLTLFSVGFFFSVFYIYYNFVYLNNNDSLYLLGYWLIISFFTIISTYIYQFEWYYDNYFMHIVAFIINLIVTFYFFYINWFDLLILWIILLIDSILIFLSYNKLKQIEE